MPDDEEKTFYDGQWRTKANVPPPQDPVSRIAKLEAPEPKPTPVAQDSVLIFDAADGGTVKKASIASFLNIGGGSSSLYTAKPATPNSFDDEFDGGSANLTDRGCTVLNALTATALTRGGDINPFGAQPSTGQYFSTIIGSWLFLQAAPGVQVDIYKPIAALTPGDTYFTRMVSTYNLATDAPGRYNEFGIYAASGISLDNNNRIYNTVRDDPSTTGYLVIDAARVTDGAFQGPGGRFALGGHDLRGVHHAGASSTTFLMDSSNGQISSALVTGTPAAATLTRVGVRNLFTAAGSNVPQIWAIDFIRKKSGSAWLIP